MKMDDWEFKTARDIGMTAHERHRSYEREGGLVESALRLIWWSGVRLSLACCHRIAYHGLEHLPQNAPFVVVANHQSHLDALIVGSALPLRMRDQLCPLAAGDVFFEVPALAAFSAMALNALPVWRKNCGQQGLKSLRQRLVEEQSLYILFPEGTRTRTGEMGPFLPGVGMMVAGTPVPVVPCYIRGAFQAFPPGSRLPRLTKIDLTFGMPFDFSSLPNRRAGWNQIAEDTEQAIRRLMISSDGKAAKDESGHRNEET
ncbi:MAG TPA: 1-acyl-sn-glycerol-3-phosphate acyltransferase [Planctomycetaceae bacterium]|nr:1-acyl-sn-glycerol-3-phosphate acyltransferase [Planctomycetaceae bacterium]